VRRLRSDDDQLSQLASHEGIQSLAVAIRRGLCELHDLVQTHSSIRGLLSEDELRIFTSEPILDEIFQARKKASRASEFLDRSSALVGIFEVEDETILEHERRLQAYDPVSVMLNTLSTFLYIVSYYGELFWSFSLTSHPKLFLTLSQWSHQLEEFTLFTLACPNHTMEF